MVDASKINQTDATPVELEDTRGPSMSAASGGASPHSQSNPQAASSNGNDPISKMWDKFWEDWGNTFGAQYIFTPAPKDLNLYQQVLFVLQNSAPRKGMTQDGMHYQTPDAGYVRSQPGFHEIFSKDGKPKKGLLSDHEILVASLAASMDVEIRAKGVKLSGTPQQMAQLQRGVEAVNAVLPEGQKLVITNPVDTKILAKFPPIDVTGFLKVNGFIMTDPAPVVADPVVSSPDPTPQTTGTAQDPNVIITPVDPIDPDAKPFSSESTLEKLKLQARLSGLTNALEGQDEKTLRSSDRLVGKRATNEGQNVYSVANTEKKLNIFYVMKEHKPIIIRLDEKGSNIFRHDTIRMKNDKGHPNYKAPKSVKSDFANAATTNSNQIEPIVKIQNKPVFDMPEATQITTVEYSDGAFNLAAATKVPVDHAATVAESVRKAAEAVAKGGHRAPAPTAT